MLDLSPVTLLFVETRAHEITKRVIEDCLKRATFGDIVVFTDRPEVFTGLPARVLPCIDFPNKKEAGRFYYSEAMMAVETDFALMLEWDAGIFDETKWRSEFFDYDYIGAPWVVRPGETQDVGNGGFTLMSRKLGRRLCEGRRTVPVYTDMDVCRFARTNLEPLGFKWPDADLASFFAWELGPRNPEHFGFHGAFTWPVTLTQEEMLARARLMTSTEYLSRKLPPLIREAPWVLNELSQSELKSYTDYVPAGYHLRPSRPGFVTPQQRALMLAHRRRPGLVRPSPQTGQKA